MNGSNLHFNPLNFFRTRFFFPSWWVKAFDEAQQRKVESASQLDQDMAHAFFPSFEEHEWDVLAGVISQVQESLLRNLNNEIHLNPSELHRHLPLTQQKSLQVLDRALQGFTSLRFLSRSTSTAKTSWNVVPIFGQEVWTKKEETNSDNGDLTMSLELSSFGQELLLGFVEPYSELMRSSRREPGVRPILKNSQPLAIWRSLWLESAGIEQILLLRLESAMQWEARWLQIEGVFSCAVDQLFWNIDPSATKSQGASTQTPRRLKTLAKIGRRLREHGLLTHVSSKQYLAFGNEEGLFPHLVWQASKDRVLMDDIRAYEGLVASYFKATRAESQVRGLAKLFAVGLHEATISEEIGKLLREINSDSKGNVSKEDYWCLGVNEIQLVSLLFIELLVRQFPGQKYPLPEEILRSPVGNLSSPRSQKPIKESYAEFKRIIQEDNHWQSIFSEIPFATLASKATAESQGFGGYINEVHRSRMGAAYHAAEMPEMKPALSPKSEPKVEAPSPVQAEQDKKGINGVVAAKMRKTASEELESMRKIKPESYQKLRNSYIESLDQDGKRLFFEVQKHMPPVSFEKHLHQKLVQFMIQNPGAWKTSETRSTSDLQAILDSFH